MDHSDQPPVLSALSVAGHAPGFAAIPAPRRSAGAVPPPLPATGAALSLEDAAALDELRKLQKGGKSSWVSGVVLLVVSLAVSAGLSARQWTWQKAVLICAILFVHELGHYLAMRVFRYRDLRMFFVPLVGAAVSGRNHNVPGWKKAVVSLMGPLPGIGLGVGMVTYAAVTGNGAVADAALLVIFINAFNLLPILPFDGGRFWDAVLFSRNRWLQIVFQTLAAAACMAASAYGIGRFFLYIGIALLVGLPRLMRTGAAVGRLRARGWRPAVADGEDTISEGCAKTIFDDLKAPGRRGVLAASKVLAADALAVFEKLNATPPNWLETLGLSALYGGALVVALAGIGFASLLGNTGSHAAARAAALAKKPAHVPVTPWEYAGNAQAHTLPVPSPGKPGAALRSVWASWPDDAAAGTAFVKLHDEQARPGDSLTLFGRTIIVQTPRAAGNRAHAQSLVETLRGTGSGSVIDSNAGYAWGQFDLAFNAPDPAAAREVYREVNIYLRMLGSYPIDPPWNVPATIQPEQRAASLRACETYLRIEDAWQACQQDDEMQHLMRRNRLPAIFTRQTMADRSKEIVALRKRLQHAALDRLQHSADPALDQRVIAAMGREPSIGLNDQDARREWRAEMKRLIAGDSGALPAAAGVPAKASEADTAADDDEDSDSDDAPAGRWSEYTSGKAEVADRGITLTSLNFSQPAKTIPELAAYLAAHGCTEIRYGCYDRSAELMKSVAQVKAE